MISSRIQKLANMKKMAEEELLGRKYVDSYPQLATLDYNELYSALADDIVRGGTTNSGDIFLIAAVGYFLGRKGMHNTEVIFNAVNAKIPKTTFNNRSNKPNLKELLSGEESGLYGEFIEANMKGIQDLKNRDKNTETEKDPSGGAYVSSGASGAISGANDKFTNRYKSSGPSSGSGSSNNDNTAVINEEHRDKDLADSEYKYHTDDEGLSFSWTSINDTSKNGNHKQGDKNWAQMVIALNALTATDTPAAPAAATPAATAPAASKETKQTATPFDDSEKMLAAVLSAMYNNKLVGTPGLDLVREVRYVKAVMDGVANGVGMGKTQQTATARILLMRNEGLKKMMENKEYEVIIADTKFLGTLQQEINSLYRDAFDWAKTQEGDKHVGLLGRIKGGLSLKNAVEIIHSYIQNTYLEKKSSSASLDRKFVKRAQLRRLKIRSQMEAAIDSSAQMGRSRVS